MCPDPQILSIYMDGELPSPWKEKMESHLTECSKCNEKLKNLFHMQELLKNETSQRQIHAEKTDETLGEFAFCEQELMEKAKERIWQKLEAGHRFRRSGLVRQNNYAHRYNMWKRKISIPIPAAAAAAIIIALMTAFWINNGSVKNNGFAYQGAESGFTLASDDIPQIIPAGNLNSVLEYLGVDRSEVIILQLPESSNFSRSGDPAIIRSADYTRR